MIYLIAIVLLIWIVVLAVPAALSGKRHGPDLFMQAVIWGSVGIFVCLALIRLLGSSRIEVDDTGIRWKEGRDEGFLAWQDISQLVQDGDSLGLVERASARVRKLPFTTRKLHEALSGRLNKLKPAEEGILFR